MRSGMPLNQLDYILLKSLGGSSSDFRAMKTVHKKKHVSN